MKTIVPLAVGLTLLTLMACSSVRIQTGPPTEKQATAASEDRGQGMRSKWADQLGRAKPMDKMWMVRQLIDSTDALLIRIGRQISRQWNEGEVGRGSEIAPDEMRGVIDASLKTDQPMLDAYDEMVDYGIEEVRLTRFFDEQTMGLLMKLRDHYDRVHGEVLFPSVGRVDYDDSLHDLKYQAEDLSAQLKYDLERY